MIFSKKFPFIFLEEPFAFNKNIETITINNDKRFLNFTFSGHSFYP